MSSSMLKANESQPQGWHRFFSTRSSSYRPVSHDMKDSAPADDTTPVVHATPPGGFRRRCLRWLFYCVLSGLVTLFLVGGWEYSTGLRLVPCDESEEAGILVKPRLEFRRDNNQVDSSHTFKIVQITDIHLGEAENLDWGPEQDRKTWVVLDSVLTKEAPIDLIVLGGDQLTANNCRDNATAYYQELGEFLTPYGVPWALIFGNHDDTDYDEDEVYYPPKYLRPDLLKVDQSFPLSLTQAGPEGINGTSNYVLDITLDGTQAAQVFLLDSGGGSITEAITDSQVEWFEEQVSKSTVPAVAFQHIPTEAHVFDESGSGSCQGFHGEAIDTIDYDGGIMEALAESERFFFLAVGHNHGNDYCCSYQDSPLHVCFGRHSGYGGYGHWDRGSRVYELSVKSRRRLGKSDLESNGGLLDMQWSSWVRLESGEVIDKIDN